MTVLDVLVALAIVAAWIAGDAYLNHAAHRTAVTGRPHLTRHPRHVTRRAVGVDVASIRVLVGVRPPRGGDAGTRGSDGDA